MGDVVQIYEDYKDHADFLTVYVREAHPTDEWQMKSNVKDDVCYAQPKTLEQRVAIANDFTKRFKFPLPFGIDDMPSAFTSLMRAAISPIAAGWDRSITNQKKPANGWPRAMAR